MEGQRSVRGNLTVLVLSQYLRTPTLQANMPSAPNQKDRHTRVHTRILNGAVSGGVTSVFMRVRMLGSHLADMP